MTDQTKPAAKAHLCINEGLRQLEPAAPARSFLLFEHGTLQVNFYIERGGCKTTQRAASNVNVCCSLR